MFFVLEIFLNIPLAFEDNSLRRIDATMNKNINLFCFFFKILKISQKFLNLNLTNNLQCKIRIDFFSGKENQED